MPTLPCCVPDVWGEGLIFGYSGMDGPTVTATGFVATAADERYDLLIHTPRRRRLVLRTARPGLVRAATGDVLIVDTPDGHLTVSWSAWHSITGCLPEGGRVELSSLESTDTDTDAGMTVSRDGMAGDVVGLLVRSARFACCWAPTVEQLRVRLEAALATDLDTVVTQRLRTVQASPLLGVDDDDRLLRKCVSVMKVNTCAPEGAIQRMWSTPDRVPHRHMWLWDSVFHSFAMDLLDPALSLELVRAVLDRAWTAADAEPRRVGMVSHMSGVDGTRSAITQPPILAWAVLENQNARPIELEVLREILPALDAYLRWDVTERDANGNGLLEWHIEGNPLCRSGESGLDNSPRFDRAAMLDAVDFSVFAANDMFALADLWQLAGDTDRACEWRSRAQRTEDAVHSLLWSEEDGFYYDADMDGCLTGVRAVTGFFPLLLPGIPEERVEQLVAMLDSEHFATAVPIPSVAATDPGFGTDMWRGATWLNTNFVVYTGFLRHGRRTAAAKLRDTTLSCVGEHYRRAGVLFEFYDAEDRVPPEECQRKGPLDGKPYLCGKVNSIRDYHWTAAVCARLLLDRCAAAP